MTVTIDWKEYYFFKFLLDYLPWLLFIGLVVCGFIVVVMALEEITHEDVH